MKYTADEVASIMFCSTNKSCPDIDTNSNDGSSSMTSKNTKDDPCNGIHKHNENTGKIKPKPVKSRNSMY
ncbi:MAG: hypothetical protein WKG06_22955 [Segetibacter sp.]